jgi:hypothetical protein
MGADQEQRGSLPQRFSRWLEERTYDLTRSKCPYCRSTPVRGIAEMVVFTNSGYQFPRVALTYCLMCEQLLGAQLAEQAAPCEHASHIENDIADSDTLPLRNPHRITDIVFSSCAECGRILDCAIH